jgi:hypothetical protein
MWPADVGKLLDGTDLLQPPERFQHTVRRDLTAEVRRHLGVESQRQWSDLAVARTTPALLASPSIILANRVMASLPSSEDGARGIGGASRPGSRGGT